MIQNRRKTQIGLALGRQQYYLKDEDYNSIFPASVSVNAFDLRAELLWSTKRWSRSKEAELGIQVGGFLFARTMSAEFSSTPPAYGSSFSTYLFSNAEGFTTSLGPIAIIGVQSDKFAAGIGMSILLLSLAHGKWERTDIVEPVGVEPETVTSSGGSFSRMLAPGDLGKNSLLLNDLSFRFSYTFGR